MDAFIFINYKRKKKLCRSLKDGECVHHIDGNKFNNDITNLMIFKTITDHTAFRKGNKIHKENDIWVAEISNPIIKTSQGVRMQICPCCGKLKSYGANICSDCYSKEKAKNIPPKEDLKKLITKLPMVKIGKLYGVSDNAVRKWCMKYELPYKRKDILKIY